MSHYHRKPWAVTGLIDSLWRPRLPTARLGRLKALSLSWHNTTYLSHYQSTVRPTLPVRLSRCYTSCTLIQRLKKKKQSTGSLKLVAAAGESDRCISCQKNRKKHVGWYQWLLNLFSDYGPISCCIWTISCRICLHNHWYGSVIVDFYWHYNFDFPDRGMHDKWGNGTM